MSLHTVIKCNGCRNHEEFPAGENITHLLSKYGWLTGAISKWNGMRVDFCPDCLTAGNHLKEVQVKSA